MLRERVKRVKRLNRDRLVAFAGQWRLGKICVQDVGWFFSKKALREPNTKNGAE
jgi:hypothetical protein